ncbi:protein kinase [Streptomyces sp. NPDC048623]|uniref:serine/threonine-protein kinase n=1 Tax=Streptomyces sp. NPDC048623 TaxID=3155761 RepID=UPI00342A3DD7
MLEALPAGPPRLVGPYRLLARLGAGGMGEVHLACRVDAPTADPYRMVAVKTVREELAPDEDFRTRFRREITAARAVRSPYAAQLVDADADAPSPWLATEYVPGPSLAEAVVRAGALPLAAVRALGAALARALDAVHGAQVLHRDLKPANVLLGAAGPKLIDFGIAQAFEATALTSTGLVVGSPGFMSPEHLIGSRAVVPASDVFCLGAVLAFAASGQGPFQDDEMAAVIYRISRAEAELTGVPEELRPVVERCLRLDPAERPSAAELVELLGGGDASGVFPWPGGVLSLLAEYGDAARKAGEAAASGAGVADLPTLGPVVPYSPTAAGFRPAEPSAPGPRRRPWGRIVAAAVAVAVVATVGVVVLDRQGGQGSATAQGPTGSASASPSSSASGPGAPQTLSQVVLPYGGEGHTGDFGKAATDRAYRPAGWSPWTYRARTRIDACALAPKVLVCAGGGGQALGLRASDGKKLWSVPPPRDVSLDELEALSSPAYPAVVGDTVYLTGRNGVTAYGVEDGKERGKIPAPGPDWAGKGSELRDGVLYSAYLDVTDGQKALVTAARVDGKGGGKELWRHELKGIPEQLVAGEGRVYVPLRGGVPVALDAVTGEETARGAAGAECPAVVVHKESVLCRAPGNDGVLVLDARTLRLKRTLRTGPSFTGEPVVSADGIVAVTGGETGHTVATYDLESGKELVRADILPSHPELTRVYFAGDVAVAVGGKWAYSFPASGPVRDHTDLETFEAVLPKGAEEKLLTSTEALVSGGTVFLPYGEVVVSGYLP